MCIRDRIDTGANISLIDRLELNRIQELSTEKISTLPINNIAIIGATGKQNKTIKQQVSLNVTSMGVGIPVSYTHLIILTRNQNRSPLNDRSHDAGKSN